MTRELLLSLGFTLWMAELFLIALGFTFWMTGTLGAAPDHPVSAAARITNVGALLGCRQRHRRKETATPS
jgi:hypothetical protein